MYVPVSHDQTHVGSALTAAQQDSSQDDVSEGNLSIRRAMTDPER